MKGKIYIGKSSESITNIAWKPQLDGAKHQFIMSANQLNAFGKSTYIIYMLIKCTDTCMHFWGIDFVWMHRETTALTGRCVLWAELAAGWGPTRHPCCCLVVRRPAARGSKRGGCPLHRGVPPPVTLMVRTAATTTTAPRTVRLPEWPVKTVKSHGLRIGFVESS